ncbi:hypothetical protein CIW48_01655 [Methylobacterium sp. P1-11]|uniref:hypothetical protein n=1 Tax=Methylobacterium sp. P1-11 TaxID=2024616 RepID=UPI0011EBA35C|nr:hypothetical protein [Methylobacterium sp. P1-11]KAA0125830.1 hypothetical protein CIW48_01655 [Methylobacterium sp. P1-11]
MFVNGDALAGAFRFLMIALVLCVGIIVAHLVWVSRIARRPALAAKPVPTRFAIVGAALATPVVGFYAVEIAALRRRCGDECGARSLRGLAGAGLLTLALAAAGTLYVELRAAPQDRSLWDTARIFAGQLCLLLIGQGLVFMILRVVTDARHSALPWTAQLLAAALLVLLLL